MHYIDKQLLLTNSFFSQSGADPYCKITCEGTTVTTPVRKNTLEPQFDATAVFYVKNPAECSIKIQVSKE